jgi:hypothetical protein
VKPRRREENRRGLPWWARNTLPHRRYGQHNSIIPLACGQNLDPVPLETSLLSHLMGTGAIVVVGEGRYSPALLLQSAESVASEEYFIENASRSAEEANSRSPIYTRIGCSKIAVVQPRGLVRAPKGTVVRKLTIERFRDVIEEMYKERARSEVIAELLIYYILANPTLLIQS